MNIVEHINLKKTEGANKNGHSRDTGNINTRDKMKTNKTQKHNITQKTRMSDTDPNQNLRINPGAREG